MMWIIPAAALATLAIILYWELGINRKIEEKTKMDVYAETNRIMNQSVFNNKRKPFLTPFQSSEPTSPTPPTADAERKEEDHDPKDDVR